MWEMRQKFNARRQLLTMAGTRLVFRCARFHADTYLPALVFLGLPSGLIAGGSVLLAFDIHQSLLVGWWEMI